MNPNTPTQSPNPLEQGQPSHYQMGGGTPPAPAGGPQPSQSTQDKLSKAKTNLILVSVVAVLLLGTVAYLSSKAFATSKKLNATFSSGEATGRQDQKKADAAEIKNISENPPRTYRAPDPFGAFVVTFPRNWSYVVNLNNTLYNAYANPDYVDEPSDFFALRVNMKAANYDDLKKSYASKVKTSKGALVGVDTRISNIEAAKYTGKIDAKFANGTVVIIKVRDKVLTLQTDDNAKYGSYFDEILDKIKINP